MDADEALRRMFSDDGEDPEAAKKTADPDDALRKMFGDDEEEDEVPLPLPGRKIEEVADDSYTAEADSEFDPEVDEEFELSEERARRIEAALTRLGPLPAARILGILREIVALPPAQRESRLDEVEDWLCEQLPNWEIKAHGGEQAEAFNEGVEAGSDGLNLALELVDLLRLSDPNQAFLAEQLLHQINTFFQTARQRLLDAEPLPA